MGQFRSEITIQRPVAQVFDFVAAPENYSKWMDGVTGAKSISGPLGVGSQVQLQGRVALWNMDSPMQVTAYEPNRAFGMQGMVGPLFYDGKWEFEPTGGAGTRLTVSGEFRMAGLWRLAEPLLASEVQNGEAKELEKIKVQLEGPS
jgi:uncharacterized protein YndB with AHSA1/START domain